GISRLRRLRQTSTSNKQIRPWRPDLNETASTKPGAIQQAAAGGYKDALSKGLSQYDSVAGGITFRVYLDKFTGTVTNFHPK
ncbi:hypothetical protein Q8W89_14115, partial [Pseudomonas aeruginosa]|nr:hypothetical protein [Pseudomonas aeruginosa]MDU0654237.1 hypothetical protein [Pseudomonas aeruginosa]